MSKIKKSNPKQMKNWKFALEVTVSLSWNVEQVKKINFQGINLWMGANCQNRLGF